jgi:hypothetical protein
MTILLKRQGVFSENQNSRPKGDVIAVNDDMTIFRELLVFLKFLLGIKNIYVYYNNNMSKYILLECNRERAIDKAFDSSITDQFKNKWSNQVSNSGIVINAGDILTIDETIINTKGADTDVMEFRGEPNENNIIDNKAVLEVSYYICHNGRNTGNMPFVGHKTNRGLGTLITPFVLDNDNSNKVQGVEIAPYTDSNYLDMISKRSLGEVWLAGDGANGQAYTAAQNHPFKFEKVMPQIQKTFKLNVIERGGGLGATATASNANSGFQEGQQYDTTCTRPAGAGAGVGTGSGMVILIDSVITIGNTPNIIESYTILDQGTVPYSVAGDVIKIAVGFDAQGNILGSDQRMAIVAAQNVNYFSSDMRRYDGKKYYPLNVGFTGLVSYEDTQIDNGAGNVFDVSPEYDVDKLDNSPTKRSNTVDLEVPKGFSTPSAVSNVLTEQLSRPEKLSSGYNKGDFLDLDGFQFFHTDTFASLTNTGKPNIIASKIFQPHSANFYNNGKVPQKEASFSGRRNAFYQSIAWKEPERFTALIPAFRQFKVMQDVYTAGNEIQTGIGTTLLGANKGDFGRAGSGEFGPHPTILNFLAETSNSVILTENNYIVSNILYTKSNIQKIAKMKGAEKYMGDLSLPVDTTSDNYRNYLCANLDVCYYDDELSTQGLLSRNDGETGADGNNPPNLNQRIKFANRAEAVAANKVEVPVGNTCSGFQRDLDNVENDGQQLSNLWVKTRWNDDLKFNRIQPQSAFTQTFTELQFNPNSKQKIDTANTFIGQVFGSGHTDSSGNFISLEEMNSWAKLYDVAVVPFNVPINPDDATQNQDINQFPEPFVAFVIATNYASDAVFDKTKQFSKAGNNWKADSTNFNYGSSFGIDVSFTRNRAVSMQNNQLSESSARSNLTGAAEDYLNYINLGAVNPAIEFDPNFSRFSISGLNTPLFIGNGLTTDDANEFIPTDNPQQQTLMINGSHQITPNRNKDIGDKQGNTFENVRAGQYGNGRQEFGSIIDSQSGVSIESISVYDGNNNLIKFSAEDLANQADYLYHNTLFDKMGFDLNTLIPKFGSTDAFFRNPSITVPNNTYETQLRHTIKPMTTGVKLNSNIAQTFSVNNESAPLFDLGGDTLRRVQPDTEQGEITATRLASKFDFSYLCVYSSLISEGTDTIYIGGNDNQSRLSCMTYLTRENNESDFFYQGEKGFNFTATKDFVITDITTDIRLPNGERPILNSASTVIYKIEKPLRSLPTNAEPIPIPTTHNAKK